MDAETTSQKATEKSDVGSTILSSRSLYQHDPLLVLLKDKLHRITLWIVLGALVLGVLFSFIFILMIPVVDGLLEATSFLLGLLLYLLLPTSIASVFNTLRANRVIGPPHQERLGAMPYSRFLEQVVAWMDSPWWSIVLIMLIPLYFLYNIFIATPRYLTIPPMLLLVEFAIAFLPYLYVSGLVFLRVILLLIFINRLFFLFNIRVRPLHPDGSGGLAALGRLVWMSVATIFGGALFFFAFSRHFTVPLPFFQVIGIIISYLIVITALAIGWLALPHHVMLQARNEHLQPLFEEYERVLMETRPAADEETAHLVTGTERLSAIKQRYDLMCDTFPTWPIQIVEMRRLAIALLLPALISLLPALINLFTK